MGLKAQLEAIIYAAETPITLEQMVQLVKESATAEGAADEAEVKSRVRSSLEELAADYGSPDHGIEIRQVAGGYRMSTKPEQHEMVRSFAKSLKPPIRLSLPALETLAVIAYRQPVSRARVSAIRGVNVEAVMKTLLTRGLVEERGVEAETGAILYGTTSFFLEKIGIRGIEDLPALAPFLPDLDALDELLSTLTD